MRIAKPGVLDSPVDSTIYYEGRPVAARTGESIAAALVSAGHLACRTTRSTGYRGVFCGMGVCSECSVTIDGHAGRLACMEEAVPGVAVTLDPPERELAGLDGPESSSPPPDHEIAGDLVVVGAGPAGLAAALAASEAGADVVLVDNRRALGGQYFKQPTEQFALDEGALDAQYRSGRELLRRISASRTRVLHRTRVWGAAGPFQLFATSPSGRTILRSRALVLANGAYERVIPFPGWTLPGVMTAGAVQTLLRSYLVAPGSRVLVSGNGPLNLQVAAELVAAGIDVVSVAETASLRSPKSAVPLAQMAAAAPHLTLQGLRYLVRLRRVPILARSSVVEVGGDGRVEWAVVARLDREGRPIEATRRRFNVDVVSLGYGFVPSSELARMLGCAARVDLRTGSLSVVRDRYSRTSVDGIWVVGDGAGIGGAQVAQAAGSLAGLNAVRWLDGAKTTSALDRELERTLARHECFQRSLWRLYAGPVLSDQLATPGTIVCRCEEITLGELTAANAPWLAAAGPLKRVTRAGMGKCQGRYCGPIVTEVARRGSGLATGPRSGFAPQAPVVPTPVATIASSVVPLASSDPPTPSPLEPPDR